MLAMVPDLVREQIFLQTHEEVPYATSVVENGAVLAGAMLNAGTIEGAGTLTGTGWRTSTGGTNVLRAGWGAGNRLAALAVATFTSGAAGRTDGRVLFSGS